MGKHNKRHSKDVQKVVKVETKEEIHSDVLALLETMAKAIVAEDIDIISKLISDGFEINAFYGGPFECCYTMGKYPYNAYWFMNYEHQYVCNMEHPNRPLGDSFKWTPIHMAAALGKNKVIDYFLSQNCNLALKDAAGNTPKEVPRAVGLVNFGSTTGRTYNLTCNYCKKNQVSVDENIMFARCTDCIKCSNCGQQGIVGICDSCMDSLNSRW